MIPQGFRPLLAVDSSKVKQQQFPILLSSKIDGIRCLVFGGIGYSRSLKPIPNKFIQAYFMQHKAVLEGLDGELIVGDENAPDVFNKSTSGVMSHDGEPDFTFLVFDKYDANETYVNRLKQIPDNLPFRTLVLRQYEVSTQDEVDEREAAFLSAGAEGVMLRSKDGKYKHGRSGTKNPELQKVKRFKTEEFEIVGFEPKYVNTNEAKTNELGLTERSTSKQGLVAMDTLGALTLKTPEGLLFSSGSGLTDEARKQLWEIRATLIGKLASVKFFEVGMLEVPRFPIIRGIRDVIDL